MCQIIRLVRGTKRSLLAMFAGRYLHAAVGTCSADGAHIADGTRSGRTDTRPAVTDDPTSSVRGPHACHPRATNFHLDQPAPTQGYGESPAPSRHGTIAFPTPAAPRTESALARDPFTAVVTTAAPPMLQAI